MDEPQEARIPVSIVSKQYKGKYSEAWIDTARGNRGFTPKCIYVCIKLHDEEVLWRTRVKRDHVFPVRTNDQVDSFNEAVLAQHPQVELDMDKLAKLLARCMVADCQGMADIMAKKIRHHKAVLEADDMATWIHSDYEE